MILKLLFLLSLVSVALGDTLSFKPISHPHQFICQRDWYGVVSDIRTLLDKKESTFKVTPGLAAPYLENTISFESIVHTGYFLRQGKDSRIHLSKRYPEQPYTHTAEEQEIFDKEATFVIEVANLNVPGESVCSFKSFINPDRFIRVRNHILFVEGGKGYVFDKESTFTAAVPNFIGEIIEKHH